MPDQRRVAEPKPLVEKRAICNGAGLHYAEGPNNGEPLLVVPGFPDRWQGYRPLLEVLSTGFHVFGLSMRGLGDSEHRPPYDLATWRDDVNVFIRDVIGAPTIVVGHSAGGLIGSLAAALEADLIAKLVIIDIPLSAEAHLELARLRQDEYGGIANAVANATSVEDLAGRLGEVPSSLGGQLSDHTTPDLLAQYAADMKTADPRVFESLASGDVESLFGMVGLDSLPGAYRGPVLFLDGDPDAGSLVSKDLAVTNAQVFPWAERIWIAGKDHNLDMLEHPEIVSDAVRFFVATT